MGRLLRVIRAAVPAGGEQELWRQHAEYEGDVRVLTWAGIGRTSVAWCPRYGIIYQASRCPCCHPSAEAAEAGECVVGGGWQGRAGFALHAVVCWAAPELPSLNLLLVSLHCRTCLPAPPLAGQAVSV